MAIPDLSPDPVPVSDGEAVLAGSRTRWWEWGEPARDAGTTTTIIAVHGFRGDHHGLLPIVARLDGYRVITPDLPGFGESTPFRRGKHDVAAYAGWLADFCTQFQHDGPLVLLGHSFGSVITSAAVAAGLRPAALVLINPIAAPALQGPRAVLSRIAVGYYKLGAALPERLGRPLLANRLIVRGLSEVMATSDDPQLRAWIHDQHHRYFSNFADRRVVVEAFEASVSDDVGEYADRIAVPTLLIGGDRDDIVPIAAQQRLVSRLSDGRLLILADVGHLIHYERAEPAAKMIIEFLGRRI
ncbi:alpha/beta hydrolase [Microlunatus elymi]|uniref:Alpha/beta hydrolase n=1 Tax=Microlunatus elymi TaxID=2596828 RepID=A0A516PYM7_9ACTN|nr:alpha/beta hydrolase [Microlunatus elymi]QDP96081.1 alpha/beta hydrolase [Microlunatus elymi]